MYEKLHKDKYVCPCCDNNEIGSQTTRERLKKKISDKNKKDKDHKIISINI